MSDYDVAMMDNYLDECGIQNAIYKQAMQSMLELRNTIIAETFYISSELARYWARKQLNLTIAQCHMEIPEQFWLEKEQILAVLEMEDEYLEWYVDFNTPDEEPNESRYDSNGDRQW